MRPWHILGLAVAILTNTVFAHAGHVLPTHRLSGFGMLGGYGVGDTSRVQSQGSVQHLYERSKDYTYWDRTSIKGTGFSYVSNSYSDAISVASSSDNRGSYGNLPGSRNVAVTAIRDVLLTDGKVYGDSIRLSFNFFGFATREMPDYFVSGRGGAAGMRVYTQGFDVSNFFTFKDTDALLSDNFVHLGFDYTGYIENGVARGFVDNSQLALYDNRLLSADGDFHIDAAYDAKLGGYGFALAMFSMTSATGGYTESDFHASLRDITYKSSSFARSSGSGTNYVDLSTARFDSGMSGMASPVPEPASIAMWGAGAFGAFLVRRRRQSSPQAV